MYDYPNAPEELISYMYEAAILDGSACTATEGNEGYSNHKFCGRYGAACGCVGNSACTIVFGTYQERITDKLEKVCDDPSGA